MKNPALPKYFFLTAKREDKLILLLYVDYLRSYFNVYVGILISQLLYWITVKLIEKPRFYLENMTERLRDYSLEL